MVVICHREWYFILGPVYLCSSYSASRRVSTCFHFYCI